MTFAVEEGAISAVEEINGRLFDLTWLVTHKDFNSLDFFLYDI